ncbi:MAG: ABC transporter ATP-binding protein [Phycicoccus sp.]
MTEPDEAVVGEAVTSEALMGEVGEAVMPQVLVRCDDVVVRFDSVTALGGVSLRVGAGEMVAVVGHSGAGKSTLLGALSGVVLRDGGSVEVGGHGIHTHAEAVEAGVVLVPQGNALAAFLTAGENVATPLVAAGVPGPEANERAAAALASVGLGEFGGHLVEELSGGQQQRVAVARGLAARARVLLADEPTSELDHASRQVVLDLLRERASSGVAVLMTTNDLEAAATADRALHLDDGVLVQRLST